MEGLTLTTILYAAAGGMLPTFLWLWFWLTEENDHAEPMGLIALTFIGGALGVFLLLPLKPLVESFGLAANQITVLYAALEEVMKFGMVAIIAFGSTAIDRPTDYTIYLVTGALGFSALENTLYLVNPILQKMDIGSIIMNGNMRFLGATVLHSMSVALVGVILGLAYSSGFFTKLIHTIIGIALAVGLHTVFNYFIMQDTRQSTIIAIAGIWFVAVIVILLFDRLKALHANIDAATNSGQGPTGQATAYAVVQPDGTKVIYQTLP